MNYQTAYYWQEKGNGASLVLQRFQRKRGKIPVVFLAICRTNNTPGAGDFFQTRLLDWFRYQGLALCGRGTWADMDKMQTTLENTITSAMEEMKEVCTPENMDFTGVIGVGGTVLLFSCGEQRSYLLQRGFRNGRLYPLSCGDLCDHEYGSKRHQFQIQRADIQPGIGILLGTQSFFAPYTEKMLAECMDISKLDTEEKGRKRLLELGKRAEEQGEKDICAVLLVVGT